MFLIDTNVLSELQKPRPDSAVVAWLHHVDEDVAFISVASLAELWRGIALTPQGRRKALLEEWFADELFQRFDRRILDITPSISIAWGELMANARRRGVGLNAMDGFLAATARVHSLTIVTRNVRDFVPLDMPLLNPWPADH